MKEKRVWLQNRMNKEDALAHLANETFSRKTLSFYRYVKIEDPEALRDELFGKWQNLGCLGRIYLAKEGINAQMNVPEPHWDEFINDLYSYEIFKDVPFKIAVEQDDESFWKLKIKVKDKIVADGLDDASFDASDVGTHLDAESFNQMLEKEDSVCVDMRNFYESEVGHFEGAICPDSETFRDELPMAKDLLEGKEDKDVLLYCTGGIRCEKASAYLRHHGFKNVHQLHGGIIQYAHEIKEKGLDNKFKGKNFVFDERVGERISDEVIAQCHQCGASCDEHVNCENLGCNLLFIQCPACASKYKNCCSTKCSEINALPLEEKKAIWSEQSKGKKKDTALGRPKFRQKVERVN